MRINIKKVKVRYLFLIISCFLIVGSIEPKEVRAEALDTDVVTFKDTNLEAVIREKLSKPIGDITVGDMKGMTGRIDGRNRNIVDLTGIENAVNITELWLDNNQICDVTQLNNMSNLIVLQIPGNNISNITPLRNMTKLNVLDLSNNQISDFSPSSNMTKLKKLFLRNNNIKKIPESISNSINLIYLDLRNNELIGSIPEFLNNLTNLNYWDGDSEPETASYTSFSGNYLTGTVPSALKAKLDPAAFYNNLLEGETNQKQLNLLPGASLELSLNSIPTQNTLRNLVQLFDGETMESKSLYGLELVPTDPSFFDSTGKAIKSGPTTAYIKLKGVADTNTFAKTVGTVPITISNKIGSNNDLTIDFSIDNSLEVTLGSNAINFGAVSSVGGEIESTTLTVSSSLPYDISTMAYNDFIGNIDLANIIPINKMSLDIDSLGYNELSKVKSLGVGGSHSAIGKVHNLSFKMGNTLGYKKDNYNATVQFIIDTK